MSLPLPSSAPPTRREGRPLKGLFSSRTLLFLFLLALCVPPVGAQAVPSLDSIKSQAELDKAIDSLDAALGFL